ncbi:MAG: hypothetical protein J7L03_04390 [Caldisericaceae bacterium]|nr:hypothetical protein [Caldisericaceae bacterium]
MTGKRQNPEIKLGAMYPEEKSAGRRDAEKQDPAIGWKKAFREMRAEK